MSAEGSVVTGIAGRYATALFELARDSGVLDEVATDVAGLGNMIDQSNDLNRLLRSPVIASEDQGKGMAALMDKAGATELITNFVAVVAQNRRLFALRDMVRDFRTLLSAHKGEIVAEVTSAKSLNDEQLAKIKDQLGFTPVHSIGGAVNDLVTAFSKGMIRNPMDDIRYYNIKTMQKLSLK